MATLDEIAQGVVMMMEFSGLDIVPIEFRNHSPEEFSAFIKRVVELCNSGGIVLASVRLSPEFADDLHMCDLLDGGYRGVRIEFDESLGRSIRFVRSRVLQ